MKIQIIGKGVVGEATGEVLERLGNEVVYYDVDDAKSDLDAPRDADAHFVCVPENSVSEAVDDLLSKVYRGRIVVRSTVPVGTVDELSGEHGEGIIHFPEFLRESRAVMDEWDPELLVVGVPEEWDMDVSWLREVYRPLGEVRVTTARNTELLKLAMNGFFSTVISFWNEVNAVAEVKGANSHLVASLARREPRVPSYGTLHGEAFGGRCLPKDLDQLIDLARDAGVEPRVLEAVREVNEDGFVGDEGL